jgi:hypothetical protein
MIRILLTANAGILLEVVGVRFLIDALHHSDQYPFSKVPLNLLEGMNYENNSFRNVDFVLFTHNHPDHYSPKLLMDYLQHNRVRRVLLPKQSGGENQEQKLAAYLEQAHVPYWQLGLTRGQHHSYQLMSDVYLTVLGMQHTGNMFSDIDCDCILLTVKGKQILVTSDCDYENSDSYLLMDNVQLDTIFINPMFFHSEQGRSLIKKWNCKNVIVYHIPFENEDQISLRTLAHQDYIKFAHEFSNVQLLCRAEQEIILS